MVSLFKKLFGRPSDQAPTKPVRPRVCLGVEELLPRVLPSTTPLATGMGHGTGAPPALAGSAHRHAPHSLTGDQCSHGAAFQASLTNATGATGQAMFNPTSGKVTVQVKGAAASSTLDVGVGGTKVGTLTTDASGNGKTTISVSGATIQSGTPITVGDVSGSFSQVEFTASLTGATGVTGNAKYNAPKNMLHVAIKGAAANTTYNVTVNATVVGTITTNSSGTGKLDVIPASGIALKSGTTLSISDTTGSAPILQGTFG